MSLRVIECVTVDVNEADVLFEIGIRDYGLGISEDKI